MESKNAKYKEQLQRAKRQKSRNASRELSRTNSKQSLHDEFKSNQSFMSSKIRGSGRRGPRKSMMLFMDVRNKLNQICNGSQELSQNVVNMVGEIERKQTERRMSALSQGFPNFDEIKEETEDEETQGLQIKDELTGYKERLQEYSDIMKEMTEQFDRIENENRVLEQELERFEGFYLAEQDKGKRISAEKDALREEYLGLLELYEQKTVESEELTQELEEMRKKEASVKSQTGKKESVMLRNNQDLFEENTALVGELDFLRKKLSKIVHVKSSVEEINKEVESSHRELKQKLKLEVEQKELLAHKIKLISEDVETSKELMEKQHEEALEQVNQELDQLRQENRELRNDNLDLEDKVRHLEMKAMMQPDPAIRQSKAPGNMAAFESQLENNNLVLDIKDNMDSLRGFSRDDHFGEFSSKKADDFGTNVDVFQHMNDDFGLETKSHGRGSLLGVGSKLYLSKPIDEEIYDELNEKNHEIEQLKSEKQNILVEKKQEMDSLRAKIIQIQKDCNFELAGMKRRLKHDGKIFKKEKRKMQKEIDGLQARVVTLKVKTSDTMVQKDEMEVRFVKKLRLLRNKVSDYEAMIREHNLMAKKQKNQGFFRSILNF